MIPPEPGRVWVHRSELTAGAQVSPARGHTEGQEHAARCVLGDVLSGCASLSQTNMGTTGASGPGHGLFLGPNRAMGLLGEPGGRGAHLPRPAGGPERGSPGGSSHTQSQHQGPAVNLHLLAPPSWRNCPQPFLPAAQGAATNCGSWPAPGPPTRALLSSSKPEARAARRRGSELTRDH